MEVNETPGNRPWGEPFGWFTGGFPVNHFGPGVNLQGRLNRVGFVPRVRTEYLFRGGGIGTGVIPIKGQKRGLETPEKSGAPPIPELGPWGGGFCVNPKPGGGPGGFLAGPPKGV